MAQNHLVATNTQDLPNQHPNGAIIGDTNIHESTEVQDAGRYIATPGSDRHGQILPHFMEVIPDEVKAGYDNLPLGVEATEIGQHQQVDEGIQRALMNFMHIPNDLFVGGQ